MENIIIRQRREVTAMGITRVRELCAQGYIDQSGVFSPENAVSADMGPKRAVQNGKPCYYKPCRVGTESRGGLCGARSPSG